MAHLKDLEVLVLDALHHEKHHSHFSFEEAISIAQDVDAARTFLIHISHLMGRYQEIEGKCPENIHLSYDGLTL